MGARHWRLERHLWDSDRPPDCINAAWPVLLRPGNCGPLHRAMRVHPLVPDWKGHGCNARGRASGRVRWRPGDSAQMYVLCARLWASWCAGWIACSFPALYRPDRLRVGRISQLGRDECHWRHVPLGRPAYRHSLSGRLPRVPARLRGASESNLWYQHYRSDGSVAGWHGRNRRAHARYHRRSTREETLMSTLLQVEALGRTFGGIKAVSNLSFSVTKGQILGLIGPNGAGKTTVVNLVSGAMRPRRGRMLFAGEDVTRL